MKHRDGMLRAMLYAAKCYWPGISATEFERDAATRLAQPRTGGGPHTQYVGSLLFASGELVLCIYRASSRAAVVDAARRARIPYERIIDSAWLPATTTSLSTPGGSP